MRETLHWAAAVPACDAAVVIREARSAHRATATSALDRPQGSNVDIAVGYGSVVPLQHDGVLARLGDGKV